MLSEVLKTIGQSDFAAWFDIPFDFSVGERYLTAGIYEVIASRASPVVRLRGKGGATLWIGITQPIWGNGDLGAARLIFNQYGNRYFVYKIWIAGIGGGRELLPSTQERDLARSARPTHTTLIAASQSDR
jgi:hypothetical protein